MTYSIGEFSALTGLSAYTLRYYEQEQLIVPGRKENGRRCYTEDDLRWIAFIQRLKDTGMPIKEIQQYALLRAQGDTTMPERMDMLIQHRAVLQEKMRGLEEHLAQLDKKISVYQTEIEKQADKRK